MNGSYTTPWPPMSLQAQQHHQLRTKRQMEPTTFAVGVGLGILLGVGGMFIFIMWKD